MTGIKKEIKTTLRMLDLSSKPLETTLQKEEIQLFLRNTYWCSQKKDFVTMPECYRCWEENFKGNIEDDLKFKLHRQKYLRPITEEQKREAILHVIRYLREDILEELAKVELEGGDIPEEDFDADQPAIDQ